MSCCIKDTLFLVHRNKAKNEALLKRYASVAHDLPEWAQKALSSRMGSIEVSARDSFEIYLLNLKGIKPKHNYLIFCKRFAEIFDRKASIVLRKIQKNREAKEEFYISNEYFWQEFAELFAFTPTTLKKSQSFLFKFEQVIWTLWNRFLRLIKRFFHFIRRWGIWGIIKSNLDIKPKRSTVKPFKLRVE